MKTKLKLSLLLAAFLFAKSTFSQTIDFNSCSVNTTCNPFYTNAFLCGSSNQFWNLFGSPNYITFKKRVNFANVDTRAILFQSQYFNPINNLSEGIAIESPIKKNKAYIIKMVASGQRGENNVFNIPRLRWSFDKTATNIFNNCSLGDYNFPANSYLINDFAPPLLDTFSNFQESNYTDSRNLLADDDYPFLGIRALPTSGIGQAGFLLHKVIIKELKFQLQQSVQQLYCNTPATLNLTLTNPDGILGVNSYVWNLGSISNGWFYQGSPANQFITTSANTMQLQFQGGTIGPNTNISVIPYTGTTAFNYLYNVSLTYSSGNPPGLDLVGPAIIRSMVPTNNAYSFTNLPNGATVSWNSPVPDNLGTFTTSGTNADFLPHLNASGPMKISGTVTNACGIISNDSINVSVKSGCDELTAPTNLYAGGCANGSISLGWDQRGVNNYLINIESPNQPYSTTVTGNNYDFYYGNNAVSGQFRVKAIGCTYPNPYESDWSEWKSFTTVPFFPTPTCGNTVATNLVASNSCGGSTYLCGYAKYTWNPVPDAVNYQIESVTLNYITLQTMPTQFFSANSSPGYFSYGHSLSGTGWAIRFRVKANCSTTFSPWSATFALN